MRAPGLPIAILALWRLYVLLFAIRQCNGIIELNTGLVAHEILRGPLLPLPYYINFHGGEMLTGVLAAPFFLLLGENLFALKLVALTIYLTAVWVAHGFLREHFSNATARFITLCLAFPPPVLTAASLTALGNHTEVILFMMIAFRLFFRILFQGARGYAPFAALGAVCGCGLFYTLHFALILPVIFFFLWISERRLFLTRQFLVLLLSFSFSFLPWLYVNATQGHRLASYRLSRPLTSWFLSSRGSFSVLWERTWHFFTTDLPNVLYSRGVDSFPGTFLSYTYLILFLVSFFGILWLRRRALLHMLRAALPFLSSLPPERIPRELPLLGVPLLFFLAYIAGPFSWEPTQPSLGMHNRYFSPFLFFSVLVTGIFACNLGSLNRPAARLMPALIGGLLILMNVFTFVPQDFTTGFERRGFDHRFIESKLHMRYGPDAERLLSAVNEIDLAYQAPVHSRIFWMQSTVVGVDGPLATRLAEGMEHDFAPYIFRAHGHYVFDQLSRGAVAAEALPPVYVYQGAGIKLVKQHRLPLARHQALAAMRARLDSRSVAWMIQGMGLAWDLRDTQGIESLDRTLSQTERAALFRGVGMGLVIQSTQDVAYRGAAAVLQRMAIFGREREQFIVEGMGAEAWTFRRDTALVASFREALSPQAIAYFEVGMRSRADWQL